MLRGAVISVALHALLYGIPYYLLFVRQPEAAVVELDLSPFPAPPAHAARPRASLPQAWAPAKTVAAATRAPAGPEPDAGTACPPPCPDRPGDFTPAGLVASGPRWIEGFITEDDYPAEARRLGIQGSVLLAVYILPDGSVRDVRLVKGVYEVLNRAAMDRVRASRFTPATDASGRPVPCKLMLPIRFELK